MSETKDTKKKTLSLSSKGTLSLSGTAKSTAKQSLSGRSGVVEVRRKRSHISPSVNKAENNGDDNLTAAERERRAKVLEQARLDAIEKEKEEKRLLEERKKKAAEAARSGENKKLSKDELRQRELEELKKIEEEENKIAEEKAEKARVEQEAKLSKAEISQPRKTTVHNPRFANTREEESRREKPAKPRVASGEPRRRSGKLTVTQVINKDYDRVRGPSLSAQRRAKEKARMQANAEPAQKVYKEITLPETITVQELANRMTEKSGDVVKKLMQMGVMATINQTIDADTAELIVEEFGHTCKRVTEADVEIGIEGEEDKDEDLLPRPPVVTIMGHVDHGKTSLLDALRTTDIVSGEAGGITQHIGAYQVEMKSGDKITFLDTPGHAAFTEMRARGADVTDIVVLVVSANDSIMPQTIEAISHAKAAGVPIIVAINKIDLPDANPTKVKQDLLQHEIVVEDMGGDTLCIELSAKKKINLDKLEEAILLQAEILDLKANPNRKASGAVVEAKQVQGRGNVATILIQRGTLNIGDIFVVGSEWGRVRAIINDKGKHIKQATPGQPVEILGLNGSPDSGDQFHVVENEAKAREIADYRVRKKRDIASLANATSLEAMMQKAKEGEKKKLPVVIKADVHGSVEAIIGSLEKITEGNEEVDVQVLHYGVGGITESDVILAKASGALIIGFNVRANAQARDLAQKDGVDIRYYNIIYNVIDDAKAILSGMLKPVIREEYIGQAEIREVFNITKVGKVAGCMVKNGSVKRGAKVRLLRDDVVVHEGMLKTLKRFKEEVKEVREGTECGMAFETYDDIKEGDIIECFEIIEEARKLD